MTTPPPHTDVPKSKQFREVELKYSAKAPGVLDRVPSLLSGLGMQFTPATEQVVEDVYLDTADWWFYRAGISCRLRVEEGQRILQLKTFAPFRHGLADRTEFEEVLSDEARPANGSLPGEELRTWIEPLLRGEDLEPKVRITQVRTVYRAWISGGLSVDVYCDRARVNDGDAFAEIEFELDAGSPDDLAEFGRQFAAKAKVAPQQRSKFQRGVEAAHLALPCLGVSEGHTILRTDRFVDAAYRVLRRNFEAMLWNEPGTRMGLDAEYLHDMRVATRRMRAALRAFHDAIPARRQTGLKRDLCWLADILGRVRDLDVYLLELDEQLGPADPKSHSGLARYREALIAKRAKARISMLRALNTARYQRFVEHMRRFLEVGPPASSIAPLAHEPFVAVAPELVNSEVAKLVKRGNKLKRSSPDEEFHAMRIHCKRMRYLCEFFSDIYGGPARKFAQNVKVLQTILGRHQDLVVAQAMLGDFAATAKAPHSELRSLYLALGKQMADQSVLIGDTREAFFPAWKKFDKKSLRRPLKKRLKSLK
jgi:CHAD domain-containing protein